VVQGFRIFQNLWRGTISEDIPAFWSARQGRKYVSAEWPGGWQPPRIGDLPNRRFKLGLSLLVCVTPAYATFVVIGAPFRS